VGILSLFIVFIQRMPTFYLLDFYVCLVGLPSIFPSMFSL